MIETEIKLPVGSLDEIQMKLEKDGFQPSSFLIEEDRYFDNAFSQIRSGGEALRVRTVSDQILGTQNSVITFKGRKMDRISMSRRELETEVQDPEVMTALLEAIGFSMVPPAVRKERKEFCREEMTACLDQVDGLGGFLELEIMVPEAEGPEGKQAALEKINQVLSKLGYSMEDTVTNSYLSMLQHRVDEC